MILGVNHIAISVPDLEKALEFYRDLLGMKQISAFSWAQNTPEGQGADMILGVKGTAADAVHLQSANLLLELFQFYAGGPAAQDPDRPVVDHGFTHLCFAVTALDEEYQRLKDAGMRFHSPPVQVAEGVRTVYGRDPFGNVIELEEAAGRQDPSQPPI
jgi:catechol 2,3-dioxygenase-like lactoylglutathione lyase family enzyme